MPAGQPYSVPPRGIGLPDYSIAKPVGQVPVGPIYTSSDVGELAARLGSPVIFDRRGNVIWFDDFEDNLNKWQTAAVGVGASVALSTDHCRCGSQSCRLVTGDALGDVAQIFVDLPYPVLSKLGMEIAFTRVNNTIYDFFADLDNASILYRGTVRYNQRTETLQLIDSAGAWAEFASGVRLGSKWSFNIAKLVVDAVTGKYVRFILNNQEFDLSSYGLQPTGTAGIAVLGFCTSLQSALAGVNYTGYVDGAIVTQNEPL